MLPTFLLPPKACRTRPAWGDVRRGVFGGFAHPLCCQDGYGQPFRENKIRVFGCHGRLQLRDNPHQNCADTPCRSSQHFGGKSCDNCGPTQSPHGQRSCYPGQEKGHSRLARHAKGRVDSIARQQGTRGSCSRDTTEEGSRAERVA